MNNYIAIDTNIFMDLFNDQKNVDGHITNLLRKFITDEYCLLVDESGRISGQYNTELGRYIKSGNCSDKQPEAALLKYWHLVSEHKKEVPVNHNGDLMQRIKIIMRRVQDSCDAMFVYVAFKEGRVLITNDRSDIIDESPNDGRRRQELLRKTRNFRSNNSNILCSQEAYDEFITEA